MSEIRSVSSSSLTLSIDCESEDAAGLIRDVKPLLGRFSVWLAANQEIRLIPIEEHLLTTFLLWIYHGGPEG